MASSGPAKDAANAVLRAVAKGTLVRPERCELCDTTVKTYGHHWRGYDYPLDVWWVCSPCNKALRNCHDGTIDKAASRELVTGKRGQDAIKEAREQSVKPGIRDRIKELRRVPASELRVNRKNWRTHPKAQRDALQGILAEVGYADALLARECEDGTLELIDGHLRAETTPEQIVPVLVLDVTEAEADKLLLSLDPLAAMATANAQALDALLREVETGSEALAGMLAELGKDAGCEWAKNGEVVEDEVPEPPVDPVTKPGDLWLLGEHRLYCGNSSDQRDVATLTNGTAWDVAVIDPPYEASASAWLRWIMDPCIVFGQVKQLRLIPDHLWRFERVIVKRYKHRSATTQVAQRHALVAQCGTIKTLPRNKRATMDSVVEQELEREHDHQKPVGLLVEHLTHWTPVWKIVLDPFAGSGSTVLAAQAMGRQCLAMELDPGWCDVVVKRWETASGKTAQRLERKEVEAYNAGRADADTPATPKRRQAEKEQAHV